MLKVIGAYIIYSLTNVYYITYICQKNVLPLLL